MNSDKIKVVKGHIVQRTGDSIVIFDTEKSILHSFNETATFIFERLKKNISPEKISIDLGKKFGISSKEAEKDVLEFIEMMISKGLAKKTKPAR